MKGKILDFSNESNTGAISGDDGERYNFEGVNWNADSPQLLAFLSIFLLKMVKLRKYILLLVQNLQ